MENKGRRESLVNRYNDLCSNIALSTDNNVFSCHYTKCIGVPPIKLFCA